ncbi:hypothetical protein [Mesorhizobium sp. M0207]|uniref:hypothetical protein n=1 Tax=Mesorhizobium sp. M0207 TaxID=2956915 RepID=UPI0033362EE4
MDTLVLAQAATNDSTQQPVETRDAFAAQLVPHGVTWLDGTDYRIGATIAFFPVPGSSRTGPIDTWPSWIAGRFKQDDGIRILVREAMTNGAGKLLASSVRNVFSDAYAKLDTADKDGLAHLTGLWQTWFADMPGLRTLLSEAATKTAGEKTDMFQRDSKGNIGSTPDVISVPRAELARQTTLERARNLIESLAGAQSAAESDHANGQRQMRSQARSGPAQRPWSKVPLGSERMRILRDLLGDLSKRSVGELRLAQALVESPVQTYALTNEKADYLKRTGKELPEDADLKTWRDALAAAIKSDQTTPLTYQPFKWENQKPADWGPALELSLQDERHWLELTLAIQLDDQRNAAREYASSCKDCADACSAGSLQLTDYLQTLQGQRVAHRASDIKATAQSVMGTERDNPATKDAAAQNASTLQDYGDRPSEEGIGVMQLRWHALQGMPALMRAMHLTMDIEFTLSAADLGGLDALLPANGGLSDPALFLEFAIQATDENNQDCIHQQLWTLTKLRLPEEDADDKSKSEIGHCWPATTEEWALRRAVLENTPTWSLGAPEETGFLDQVDAVIDLDAPLKANNQSFRRYDVFSLNTTIASEAEQRRQAAETQVKDAGTAMPEAEQAAAAETSTLKTGGLQIVDRWRQGAVIDEIFTSCNAQLPNGRRVDANDLLIGYRFDVGLPRRDDKRNWSSLSERIVRYQHSLPDQPVDLNVIANAFSPPGDDGARPVDGATVAMGTRIVINSQGGIANGGQETAFAEQLLAVWDGDPIGMRTGAFDGHAEAVDLPVTRTLSLPVKGDLRAHRLRFGGAYALGARAVLVGGVCAPLGRAIKLYDGGLRRGMAYPSKKTAELQRFLRQERIGPPIVAVDASTVLAEFASERKGIDGKDMVVRSPPDYAAADEVHGWRFQPDETARMLFAPLVDLDFAVMHSVFDAAAQRLAGNPPGGLQDVDYDSDWGGFPLFDPKEPPEPTAIRGRYRAYESHDAQGNELEQKVTPGGFAVFRRRPQPDLKAGTAQAPIRTQEYYPDPAARYLIIALRYPDQPNRYLAGEAIQVPFYNDPSDEKSSGTPGYPDARPIRIKVKAVQGTANATLASYDDLRARAMQAGIRLFEPAKGQTPATVTLCLYPGEDFEVETWCVPALTQLQAWFDLAEAMALIMNCASDNRSVQFCRLKPGKARDNPDDDVRLRRGETSVSWWDVKSAASSVYTTLLRRPLPDIASVRRLRAIHAAGLPKQTPQGSDIRLLRLSEKTQKTWLERGEGPDEDEDGGSKVIAVGNVTFDPDTTETLELHAEAAMPFGGALDNLELGRSFYGRARGEWPRTLDGEDGEPEPIKLSQRLPAAGGKLTYMDELFGFDVARDGKVEPRRGRGVVARWQVERTQKSPASLADLTRQGKHSNDGDKKQEGANTKSRSVLEGIFPDTQARRVSVWMAATSRTARQIPDRPSYPTPEQARIDQERLLKESKRTEIILPATERPAALTPKSLLPSYAWSTEGKVRSRRTKVRIRLRRPWWTSGEEERLGIVIWPPNLMEASGIDDDQEWTKGDLAQGIVERNSPMAWREGPREIDLHRFADGKDAMWREGFFTDADLGSGGGYVTRWGADPIFASEEMAWLIGGSAFRDISDSGADFAAPIDLIKTEGAAPGVLWPKEEIYKPRFVANALMPIPDADDRRDKEAGGGTNAQEPANSTLAPEFMMVSLATYMPRFDPDFEHWYVDVDLDVGHARDPFVRFGLVRFQPFAQRHLQVSQPVAEWVQVVGYLRSASATRVPRAGRDWVSVDVGTATGVDAGKDSGKQYPGTAPGETPLLRITLIECTLSPHGQILERVARLDPAEMTDSALGGGIDKQAGGLVIKTCQAEAGASQLLNLQLPIPASAEAQRAHFAVLVEELTMTPRSTFSNEPIRKDADILDNERSIESGVRFAVRVELDASEPPPD